MGSAKIAKRIGYGPNNHNNSCLLCVLCLPFAAFALEILNSCCFALRPLQKRTGAGFHRLPQTYGKRKRPPTALIVQHVPTLIAPEYFATLTPRRGIHPDIPSALAQRCGENASRVSEFCLSLEVRKNPLIRISMKIHCIILVVKE